MPATFHLGEKEPHILARHIGEGVGPVFKNALVLALSLAEMLPPIFRDSVPKDVMMASLNDVDRVDLNISQMRDGALRRFGA